MHSGIEWDTVWFYHFSRAFEYLPTHAPTDFFANAAKINNKIFISFGPRCTDTIKKGFAGLHELDECMKHKS